MKNALSKICCMSFLVVSMSISLTAVADPVVGECYISGSTWKVYAQNNTSKARQCRFVCKLKQKNGNTATGECTAVAPPKSTTKVCEHTDLRNTYTKVLSSWDSCK